MKRLLKCDGGRRLSCRQLLFESQRHSSTAEARATFLPPASFVDASRGIVAITGKDSKEFLHGLTTNDINARLIPGRCLFTAFLNTQGRVFLDAFITEVPGTDTILIEVDRRLTTSLIDHLANFKLRRKIRIEDLSELISVAVGSFPENPQENKPVEQQSPAAKYLGAAIVLTVNDPRTFAAESFLNYSVVESIPDSISEYPTSTSAPSPVEETPANDTEMGVRPLYPVRHPFLARFYCDASAVSAHHAPSALYRALECLAGVPCGPNVYIPHKSLPFEGNIDQLGAVSFHKGCYVGQELTHRTHTMLITRKRTTPLVLGHYDDIDNIFEKFVRTNKPQLAGDTPLVKEDVLSDTLGRRVIGLDASVDSSIWGIRPASTVGDGDGDSAESEETTPNSSVVSEKGHQLYYAKPSKKEGSGTTLTPVGFVQTGVHNVGTASLRLRFADTEHRIMNLSMKSDEGEMVPVTAFLPPWWQEEEIAKAVS